MTFSLGGGKVNQLQKSEQMSPDGTSDIWALN